MMAPQFQKCLSCLMFFTLISHSQAGQPEKELLKAVKMLYDMTVSKAFEEAATANFGNKMVNRFIVKLNGKIKDVLSGKELDEELVKKFIGILDFCVENCQAFKLAVTPEAAKIPLDSIIAAVNILKGPLSAGQMKQQNGQHHQPGGGGGQPTGAESGGSHGGYGGG